ncbi:MAG TPA: imidazoleglycerol-phosphate dehydratase HisB [Candidatus Bathyarchaeia archaeon]|nr:imidazoleglycerol-phosphate dehydratase HisB [Candidatus Bathyarchaeia archaeon]
MRKDEVYRKTRETEVTVKVNLDGEGKIEVETGVGFFDHLLTSFATHSLMDLTAKVKGDLKHHAIEDLAIGLGEAISKALGNREGITRFGYATVPMDDSLASAAVDLVKRPCAVINLKLKGKKVEDMATEDIVHFFETLATSLCANIHVWTEYGGNDHHKAEAATKALALSLRQATTMDSRRKGVPSSKGVI